MNEITRKKLMESVEIKSFCIESYPAHYTEIDELMEWLNEMKNKGVTHLEWEGEIDWENVVEGIFINCYKQYEETDEQAKKRIKAEELRNKTEEIFQLEKDRKEFERLKNKLGK